MFASRTRDTTFELDESEERLYRLPPISAGPVQIEVRNAYSTKGPKGQTVFHSEPTSELELELRHSEHLKLPFRNRILAESLWHDDLWRLRVRRQRSSPDPAAPPLERRQYAIKLIYNSLLPVVEREKIPATFFHQGFELNWNRQQYLQVRLTGDKAELRVREDLRQLEGIRELFEIITNPDDSDIGISFHPGANSSSVRLDIGAGRQSGASANIPFFSIQARFPAVKVKIKLPFHDDLEEDFSELTFVARLFLNSFGPTAGLGYTPVVESNLLDRLDRNFHFPDPSGKDITVNLKERIKPQIEAELFKLQVQTGKPFFSRFGEFVQPWLVGGLQELHSIAYEPGPDDVLGLNGLVEPATGNLIVRYVGARPPRSAGPVVTDVILDTPAGPPLDDGSIRLFIVPDEEPDPLLPDPSGGGLTPFGSGGFGPQPRPDIGALAKIDHIVVLMQENRSFDQVLGYLSRDRINPKVDGLLPPGDPGAPRQVNRFNNTNFFPQKGK